MDADLDLYSIFCTVARCGSLSNAAKELYVSQPAISQSMHRLEYALGCKLFTRTSRGIALTNEGEILFAYADKAIGLIEAAEDKLNRMRTLQSGTLVIGASDTLCQSFLLPFVDKFHAEYPHIQLQFRNRTTPNTIELLRAGKVEIAAVNLPIEDDSLCVYECFEVHDVFIASNHFSRLKDKTITLNMLAKEPLMLLEKVSNSRKYVDDYAEKQGIVLHPEIELGAHHLLIEFARIGLGIACVTREYVEEDLSDNNLFEIALDPPLPPRAMGLITLDNVPLSPAAERFIQIVTQQQT